MPLSVTLVLTLSVVGACASEAAPEPARTAALQAPLGDVVLVIDGEVGHPNVGDAVNADLAAIEALGIVRATVFERFVNHDVAFSGITVETLVASAGIDPDATLILTALDDYQVRFTAGQAIREHAIFATRVDGDAIPIEEGGPIRLVFPDADGPLARDSSYWIWSIDHIEVTSG